MVIKGNGQPVWIARHREELIGGAIFLLVVVVDIVFRDRIQALLGGFNFDIAALLLLLLLIGIAGRMLKKSRNRKTSVE